MSSSSETPALPPSDTPDDDLRDSPNRTSISEPSQASTCPWRTTENCDGQCSRFMDCPSHQTAQASSAQAPRSNDELERHSQTPHEDSPSISSAEQSMNDEISAGISNLRVAGDSADPSTSQHGSTPPQAFAFPVRTSSRADSSQHPHPTISDEPPLPPTPHDVSSDEEPSPTVRQASSVTSQRVGNRPLDLAHLPAIPTRDYMMERQGSYPAAIQDNTRRRSSGRLQARDGERSPDFVLPRWQPDAEVTYCPICKTQFSIFVRKHHCRKCGRVVCNSCSPHRIIIPHQYIVRPPGFEIPTSQGLLLDQAPGGYFDGYGPAGGERVRLCNPCVPDPNTAPPQSPTAASPPGNPRTTHYRSRSSLTGSTVGAHTSNRYGATYVETRGGDAGRGYASRSRSITMVPGAHVGGSSGSSSRHHQSSLQRYVLQAGSSYPNRYSSLGGGSSSSRNRQLPPTPRIPEEDECPICHNELPSRELPNFEAAREAHINTCIQSHSTYGSPRNPPSGDGNQQTPPPIRRTGMYKYIATEKDCVDDAECTICLEEFTVGVGMARLECLCRFHRACISAWFVKHPGRCPVHQHDGFGF